MTMTKQMFAADASGGSEQRGGHRQRALKAAKVVLSDWTMIDCTLRDLSDKGARLVFDGPTSLPKEFRLTVVAASTIRPVRLLWQRGLSAGVAFAGPEEAAPHKT